MGDGADCAGELLFGAEGHRELVLQEPAAAVGAVPFPQQVQRVIELRQVLDTAPRPMRVHAVGGFGGESDGEVVDHAVGKDVRHREQLGRIDFSGLRRSLAGS